MKRKLAKKIDTKAFRVPRGTRKMVVDNQVWYWLDVGGYNILLWDPTGNKHVIEKRDIEQHDCGYPGHSKNPAMPADIRRYIDLVLLKKNVVVEVDPKAIPGRLYAFREKAIDSAAGFSIWSTVGGTILEHGNSKLSQYYSSDGQKRWEVVRKHFAERSPFILLKAEVDKASQTVFYTILLQDIVATVKIPYPRTWSGSFKETTLEWQKAHHA